MADKIKNLDEIEQDK